MIDALKSVLAAIERRKKHDYKNNKGKGKKTA